MDENDVEDLLFGDPCTQLCPSDVLLDDSDDDILFPAYDGRFHDWELVDTTSSTLTFAGVPYGRHPLAESVANTYEQPIRPPTEATQSPVRDRSFYYPNP